MLIFYNEEVAVSSTHGERADILPHYCVEDSSSDEISIIFFGDPLHHSEQMALCYEFSLPDFDCSIRLTRIDSNGSIHKFPIPSISAQPLVIGSKFNSGLTTLISTSIMHNNYTVGQFVNRWNNNSGGSAHHKLKLYTMDDIKNIVNKNKVKKININE